MKSVSRGISDRRLKPIRANLNNTPRCIRIILFSPGINCVCTQHLSVGTSTSSWLHGKWLKWHQFQSRRLAKRWQGCRLYVNVQELILRETFDLDVFYILFLTKGVKNWCWCHNALHLRRFAPSLFKCRLGCPIMFRKNKKKSSLLTYNKLRRQVFLLIKTCTFSEFSSHPLNLAPLKEWMAKWLSLSNTSNYVHKTEYADLIDTFAQLTETSMVHRRVAVGSTKAFRCLLFACLLGWNQRPLERSSRGVGVKAIVTQLDVDR